MMAALISLFFMNLNRMHSVIFMRPDFLFLGAIHITTTNTFNQFSDGAAYRQLKAMFQKDHTSKIFWET